MMPFPDLWMRNAGSASPTILLPCSSRRDFFPTVPTKKKTLLFLPPKGFEDSFYDDISIDITLVGQDGYQPTEEDIAPALNRITIEDTPCDPMLKGEKD